jgi:ATP-dependent RNA helicase RhlB
MQFTELNLNPRLRRAIAERGYEETTDVQARTLAETLQGRDVAVQSQTGTGKTAAFLITLFENMSRTESSARRKALIIVPTRELAVQIEGEAELLGRHQDFSIACFYGGTGYTEQEARLRKGVDVLIATPGRLLDLSQKGTIKLKEMGYLVIDEADRLFDMGFLPDIKKILGRMVDPGQRQSMLFSATLGRIARSVAELFLNQPRYLMLTPDQLTVDTITQELYHVKSHIKPNLLLGILQKEHPRNALIFVNMRHAAYKLARMLERNGFPCRYLSGDLPQNRRLRVIDDFMAGKFPFLVATDVAARGLHIDGLEMVMNYDLPQETENYVHRIGRTARAGNVGKAVSFACEKFGENLYPIEVMVGMKIPEKTAGMDMLATDRSLEGESRHDRRGGDGRSRQSGSSSGRGYSRGRSRGDSRGHSRGSSGSPRA